MLAYIYYLETVSLYVVKPYMHELPSKKGNVRFSVEVADVPGAVWSLVCIIVRSITHLFDDTESVLGLVRTKHINYPQQSI